MPSSRKILAACPAAIVALWSLAALGFAAPERIEQPERLVRIAAFHWVKAGRGDLMQADFTLESALPFALSHVELVCAQFARSGVEVGSSRRSVAALVPAHGRVQVSAFDIGTLHAETGSSGCRVVSISPAEAPGA